MKKILTTALVGLTAGLLSSCDTTALEAALNESSYGRPTYGPSYYPYRPAYDNDHHEDYNHREHSHKYDHPYQVGYRIGEDDFYRGYEKKYMLHEKMYNHETREKFKKGYYAGYDAARKRDKNRHR